MSISQYLKSRFAGIATMIFLYFCFSPYIQIFLLGNRSWLMPVAFIAAVYFEAECASGVTTHSKVEKKFGEKIEPADEEVMLVEEPRYSWGSWEKRHISLGIGGTAWARTRTDDNGQKFVQYCLDDLPGDQPGPGVETQK